MQAIVRPTGEVSIKSRPVRKRFMRQLCENLHEALIALGPGSQVFNQWHRILIDVPSHEALEVAARVFGVHSISQIECTCPPRLEDIVRVGREVYGPRVKGKTYAVQARRVGEHPFRSQDIRVQLGAALNPGATVNLDHPQVTVEVEVRPEAVYFFSQRRRGAGGLPLGVEGRAVCLISGGFDSAVAAWMMLKRGVALDYVLCNLAGPAYERTVLGVAKLLADNWSCGTAPRLHSIDFEPYVFALRRDVEPRLVQVLLKRLMYRAGAAVARELGAEALITGESVGQVSSQTLTNLRVIDEVSDLPVLRPLIGLDKEEIIAQSRRIGTYALCERVQEYCALAPERPATAARLAAVRHEETRLDLEKLNELVAARRIIDLATITGSDLVVPYLHTEEIPDDAVVIDCRQPYHYEAWHWPGAQRRDLDDLLTNFNRLDRAKKYVLYCPLGLQSAVVAEKMQRAGYQAYSFKGGTRALRQYAEARGEFV